MIFRLAFLELWRSKRWTILFVLNLSLGIIGFLTLNAYESALRADVNTNAKNILSADLEISARKEIPEETIGKVREVLPQGYQESNFYDFFAMLSAGHGSRLVMVKTIDDNYPFYGSLTLDNSKVVDGSKPKTDLIENGIYIYPELAKLLDLKVGDQVVLGKLHLTVKGLVSKDSTQTFRMAILAPRVYIHRKLLAQSGLVQFGSTFAKAYIFKFNEKPEKLFDLRKKLLQIITDPAIYVEIPQTAGEDSSRELSYLSDFLGLVSIVALLLSALGASYLFRLFFSRQLKDISIYRILGLSDGQLHQLLAVQALLLSLGALVIGSLGGFLFTPILNRVLSQFSVIELSPQLDGKSIFFGFVISFISSYFLIIPHLSAVLKTPLQKIFSGQLEELEYSWLSLGGLGFFLCFIYILSVGQSQSLRTGTIFFAALVASLVALYLLSYLILGTFKWIRPKDWAWQQVFLKIGRSPREYSVFFVTLGLGVLLVNVIPQLKSILSQDLTVDPSSPLPSSFMFDIQEDQKSPLEDFLKQKKLRYYFSPMIRAKITAVNGEPFERSNDDATFKTREDDEDARFRNRGVNLSYRPELLPSESIVKGDVFPLTAEPNQQIPFVSIEEKYADRLKIHIGDKLKFEVQGVEIEGQVKNFRRVKWTSFQPNFFILLQKGIIDEAPKTYIASVSGLPLNSVPDFVADASKAFPNVSIIDVHHLIDDVLELLSKMGSALQLMSLLAILVGIVVLFAIIRTHSSQRRRQLNLFKILGAEEGSLRKMLTFEYGLIAVIASFFGVALSLAVSASLGMFIFKTDFKLSWQEPLIMILVVLGFTMVLVLLSTNEVVKEHPQRILNEEV